MTQQGHGARPNQGGQSAGQAQAQGFEREKLVTLQSIESGKENFARMMRVAELKAEKERKVIELQARQEEVRIKAKIDAQAKIQAEQIAADVEGKRIAAEVMIAEKTKPEPVAEPVEREDPAEKDDGAMTALAAIIAEMQKTNAALASSITAPKKIVRDQKGDITGVEPA